jgi:hypothetical protein
MVHVLKQIKQDHDQDLSLYDLCKNYNIEKGLLFIDLSYFTLSTIQ